MVLFPLKSTEISVAQEQDDIHEQVVEIVNIDKIITLLSYEYMVDEQLARRIIMCESSFNPDARNYNAKVGVDIGYFQINSHYWEAKMLEMGWDIYNPYDNLRAGFWLLSKQGTQPWFWSKHCWEKRG